MHGATKFFNHRVHRHRIHRVKKDYYRKQRLTTGNLRFGRTPLQTVIVQWERTGSGGPVQETLGIIEATSSPNGSVPLFSFSRYYDTISYQNEMLVAMLAEVPYVCKGCEISKGNKTQNYFHKPPMAKLHVTERPFQRLYIEFMCPFPLSYVGKCFAFDCLNHFSMFVFFKPIHIIYLKGGHQVIRSYINGNQKNWDKHLTDAAFALRNASHS